MGSTEPLRQMDTTAAVDEHAGLGRLPAEMQAVGQAFARALTPDDVARVVSRQVLPLTGAALATLAVLSEAGDGLELLDAGADDLALTAPRRIPLEASASIAEAVRTRQPLWLVVSSADARGSSPPSEVSPDFPAMAVLPLVLDDHVSGALALGFAEERAFGTDERALLMGIAAHCAAALERAATFARERASRERLELALQAANMGTWDWDLRTNHVAWSPQLEIMHGFAPGAFDSTLDALLAHIYPEDLEQVREGIRAAQRTGELRLDYRALWPSGDVHWYEARGHMTRDASGSPLALRGVCIDVSPAKQAEHALRESEEHFRTLADNIAQFAWMADASGFIFWYNQRWYEYTGTTIDEMRGWGWTAVHHPDHVDRVVARLKHSWETGEPWEDTFPLRGRNGQYRWFLSRALPIRDERGRIVRWFGTNTDITERRWAEALVVGERNALELIARGSPSTEVLGTLCRTVEELADDGLLASILLLDQDRMRLRYGAAPSLPATYSRALDGLMIGPNAGSCGAAAFRGEPVIVTDIATDPLWADHRELALSHGLRACWSTPIRSLAGEILGVFALYYREARTPTTEHLRLADLVSRTAAVIIERKRADDVRARLGAIVDSSDDEITGKTLEGIVTSWNAAAVRLYGYTAEERVGRSITEIIPAEHLEEHSAIMARVARGERVPAWDTARLHKDGHRVEVSLSLSPILDDTGQVTGVSAIGRAVGERRRLEAERDRLLAAEREARELAEAAGRRLGLQYRLAELLAGADPNTTPPVLPAVSRTLGWDWAALWRVDPEAGVLRCAEAYQSDALLDPFGEASRGLRLAPGEGLLGRVWQSGEPRWVSDLPREPGFTRSAAAQQVGLRSGVVIPLRVGRELVGVLSFMSREERPFDGVMLATLLAIGGQLGQFLERRRTEETLRRQAALLELAPMAVTMRDAERRIVYWNPAAEALYGWSAREALGHVSHDLLHTRFPVSVAAHEALLEREGAWEGELVRRRRDGREVTVGSRWLLLRNERGETHTLEVSTDITERKQVEAERARLLESERAARAAAEAAINARDEFVAMVSHDLRNPLAAIKGHIQMVHRRAARGETLTARMLLERLNTIESSITALSTQIDELHDAARLQAGHSLDLRPRPTDLVALARESVRHYQHASESHVVRVASQEPELVGSWDPDRLERVLANLLSNAVKYSPAGGEVLVQVAREDQWAVLAVSDQGIGIPEADRATIFERYRRASNVSGQIAGTGLGLAGARDVIQQHGGTISVRSREGHGSTFFVRLPLS
ncbi:MAG TPA: PAS domain S-box protein [Chloroflexota bacterium]